MLHDISPEMTGLVSNWCNTLLYGITVATYTLCMYVLIKRSHERTRTATRILIATSTIQFILATIYVAVALHTLIDGFIHTENVPNGALHYWKNPASKSQVLSNTIYITNSTVGDFVLIWRLYMVWAQNVYVCILPAITAFFSAVAGYVSIGKLVVLSSGGQPASVFEVLHWILASWCLSIATQVISTCLIAGMIWWHARRNVAAKRRYAALIAIIMESGVAYTLSTVFLLVFAELKTQAGAIPAHMVTQIATIVPTIIIIRVELSRSKAIGTSISSDLKGRMEISKPIAFCSADEEVISRASVSIRSPSYSQKDQT